MKFRPFLLLAMAIIALTTPPQRSHADESDDQTLEQIEVGVKSRQASAQDVATLIQLLQSDTSTIPIKERAAWALGFVGEKDKNTVPVLLKAAEHKGLLVRSAAINSLIRLRAKSALPILEKVAAADPILAVRRDATLGLGLLESEKAIQPLVELSSDASADIRGAAALAMSALQSKKNDFREILKEIKADADPSVQERAGQALLIAKGKNAAIRPQLASTDRDVRLFTALYFLRHGTAADKKAVQAAADGEADDEVRGVLEEANAAIKKRSAAKKPVATKKSVGSAKKAPAKPKAK